jgi:two-component system sensor histidine kinase SenX3
MRERVLGALRLRTAQQDAETSVAASTLAVLQALPLDWLIVGDGFTVEAESDAVPLLGITKASRLQDKALRTLVTQAVRTREVRESELDIGGSGLGAALRHVRVRVCPLDASKAVLLLEDVTHPLRVDAMRRDFIVNVSHELKTPVGALLLLAEAAKSAIDDPQSLHRFIDRMQTEADRLGRLINDLTDLSRLQSSEPSGLTQSVAVGGLFAEAADSVQLLANNRNVEVVIADVGDLRVEGDEDQLVAALRNLLANAITYSPVETRVTMSATVTGDRIDLMVSDQGIGIPEAEQQRIFERFYRVDPARSRATGGTGLGLSIVKHICAAHGGECVVWSKPGEGSTFTLRLRHGHVDAALSAQEQNG